MNTSKIESLIERVSNPSRMPGFALVRDDDFRALVNLARVAVAFRAAEYTLRSAIEKQWTTIADMAEIERVLGRVTPTESERL